MDSITCIYCREKRPQPAKGEHIMLDALGGQLRTRHVCDPCNQTFGNTIDRELLRSSIVAMQRFFEPSKAPSEQHMFARRDDHAVWLDVWVTAQWKGLILPAQLYVYNHKLVCVAGPGQESRAVRLRREPIEVLANAPKYLDDCDAYASRVVADPWRDRYFVRARTEAEYHAFMTDLPRLQGDLAVREDAGGAHTEIYFNPRQFLLTMSTDMNATPRCIAKMAFNFVAYHFGPAVALRTEFDAVRRFITGEDVLPVTERLDPESGEIGLTLDTRYVDHWLKDQAGWSVRPELAGHHYVALLLRSDGNLGAEVGLFGGRTRFHVRFGTWDPAALTGRDLPAVLITSMRCGEADRVLVRDAVPLAFNIGSAE